MRPLLPCFLLTILTLTTGLSTSAQSTEPAPTETQDTPPFPKSIITQTITSWFTAHTEGYNIDVAGKEASALVTRYHPERPEEKNQLIEVHYQGMRITLRFKKPLEEITTHKDSLQKHFDYVSLSRICHDISTPGWDTSLETSLNALRGTGVTFHAGGDVLSLSLDWTISHSMSYKNTSKCRREMAIEDGSVSEGCYAQVAQRIPLHIEVKGLVLVQ